VEGGIAEVGKCQNVVVKLGGLGMLFGMFDFHTRETPPSSEELARAYQPYIETCIAALGHDAACSRATAAKAVTPSSQLLVEIVEHEVVAADAMCTALPPRRPHQ
jgi:hypothetical protein